MAQIGDLLLSFLREAWGALAGAILLLFLLALLAQVLKATTAGALGARLWVQEAASAGIALAGLALFAYLGVPAILEAAQSAIPGSAGCGPIADLSALAAMLIAGLAAVRILAAALTSIASAAAGGQATLSEALISAGEAVFGIALAAAAVPIAAGFLGGC
jgi:hypothetical protein